MKLTALRAKLEGNKGQTVAALLIYLGLSLCVFFIGTGGELGADESGPGGDTRLPARR